MIEWSTTFGGVPHVTADAPGRVNLLGEHTDYNEGFVLPTAVPQRTRVSMRRSGRAETTVFSANLNASARFTLDTPPQAAFARYVYGCVREIAEYGAEVPALEIHVQSEVPIGLGLSSSAALEVATLRALRALLEVDLDDVRLAQLAQRAEVRHAGVNCGILDQMACSLLAPGQLLFLDTRSLERKLLPLPGDAAILVIDSGRARALATSGYNARRAECEQAAQALGVRSLREVSDSGAVEGLPEPLRSRARHVVTENARVVRASHGVSAELFGALMLESHRSLRDDYAVSTEDLDALVALLERDPQVYGAKLTGAGFGGACVALCERGAEAVIARRVLAKYDSDERRGAMIVPSG